MKITREEYQIMLSKMKDKGVKQLDLITKNAMPSGRGPNAGGLSGSIKVPEPAKSVTQGRESLTDPSGSPVRSSLETKFQSLWTACGGPPLSYEFRICSSRKWRADFAHLESQTIIEIDGGVWVPGGHNMAGHVRDCERDLECVLAGWRVVRLVPSMITVSNIERLIAFVKGER